LLWLWFGSTVGVLFRPVGLAVLMSVAVYLLVVLFESGRLGRRASAWRLPLVFAAIHAGFGWGYLGEFLAGTWKVLRRSPVDLRDLTSSPRPPS
jgi:hypothetical protein